MKSKDNPTSFADTLIVAEKPNEVNNELEKIQMKKLSAETIQEELFEIYKSRKEHTKAQNIKSCGTFLSFRNYFNADRTKELRSANFCKHSLCPMCAWRLHLKNSKIMEYALNMSQKRLYHVVLAIPNETSIQKNKLSHLRRSAVQFIKNELHTNSYFINLEITKGKSGFHPHLHCVIETSDFIKVSKKYIIRMSRLWKSYYENIPIDDIEKGYTFYITGITDKQSASKELTKYIFKDTQQEYTAHDIEQIADATYNLRKISSAGNLKKLYQEGKEQIYIQREMRRYELIDVDYEDTFFAFLEGEYKQLKIIN